LTLKQGITLFKGSLAARRLLLGNARPMLTLVSALSLSEAFLAETRVFFLEEHLESGLWLMLRTGLINAVREVSFLISLEMR